MDVSTPPSLDLACPQAEAEIEKYVHMFRNRGDDKNKIRGGAHPQAGGVGSPPPTRHDPCLLGPLVALRCPSSAI